jgi:hypothetical protein
VGESEENRDSDRRRRDREFEDAHRRAGHGNHRPRELQDIHPGGCSPPQGPDGDPLEQRCLLRLIPFGLEFNGGPGLE